ncbi:MAG: hypothetical protein R3E89_13210 [Thiolinea sp.]
MDQWPGQYPFSRRTRIPARYPVAGGFSLLEILVAFVIMGLVVGALLQVYGSSMRNVALADEYSFAVQIAESRLQAVGGEIEVEQGSVSGTETSTPQWTISMEPVQLDEERENFPCPCNLIR